MIFLVRYRSPTFDYADVEIYHLETPQPLEFSNVSITAQGPLRASITAEVKYGKSTINVTVGSEKNSALHCNSAFAPTRFRWTLWLVSARVNIRITCCRRYVLLYSFVGTQLQVLLYLWRPSRLAWTSRNFEVCVWSLLLWFHTHFVSVELPLNIHSDNATYEMQFGYVQRPTHKNTTWDSAKFEVCGHKVSCMYLCVQPSLIRNW